MPNGSSIMDTQSYTDVTETQITQVLSLLQDYRYYRKWNTYISDGSLSGLGDDLIQLRLYDATDDSFSNILISSSGGISVNDKVYGMRNPQKLINELLDILNNAKLA